MTASQSLFLLAFLFGSITDAVWLALRFPRFGPQTMKSAGIAFFSGAALMAILAPLIGAAGDIPLPAAGFLAAFGVGFLGFVYFFLTGLWFVRVMVGAVGGLMR